MAGGGSFPVANAVGPLRRALEVILQTQQQDRQFQTRRADTQAAAGQRRKDDLAKALLSLSGTPEFQNAPRAGQEAARGAGSLSELADVAGEITPGGARRGARRRSQETERAARRTERRKEQQKERDPVIRMRRKAAELTEKFLTNPDPSTSPLTAQEEQFLSRVERLSFEQRITNQLGAALGIDLSAPAAIPDPKAVQGVTRRAKEAFKNSPEKKAGFRVIKPDPATGFLIIVNPKDPSERRHFFAPGDQLGPR